MKGIDVVDTGAIFKIGKKQKAPLHRRIFGASRSMTFRICTHQAGQVEFLLMIQQIRAGNLPGPTLARGSFNQRKRRITYRRQIGRSGEGRGQVSPPTFDKDQVRPRKALLQFSKSAARFN